MDSAFSESRVLVIYTGGTIGMLSRVGSIANSSTASGRTQVQVEGLAPEPFFLTESLRSQSRFHDPFEDSLFSHAGSVEGFRKWSIGASGRSSPTQHGPENTLPIKENTGVAANVHTTTVRSSRPIMTQLVPPNTASTKGTPPISQAVHDSSGTVHYESQLPTLVTPRTQSPSGFMRRIRYAILEWQPLLDSSDIGMGDWIRIAKEIDLNYDLFDAFVILHGTDTMCYTSSALSFLLEDLGKTVIITGAQIPLSQLRNDAFDNFLGALWIAGHYIIPECCLFFDHKLFRGNRASKISSFDLNAFNSPNFAPLVKVGIDVSVNWNSAWRQQAQRKFHVHKEMCPEVATLRLFPGITAATVRAFLAPPIKGVVLETFGAGNAPQRTDLSEALQDASRRGVVIVAISQCVKGSVENMYKYETGRALRDAGVVPGGDMTPECALTKLSYLLSKPALGFEQIRALIQTPLRGELTISSAVNNLEDATRSPATQHLLERIVTLSSNSTIYSGSRSLPTITVEANEGEREGTLSGRKPGTNYATDNALRPLLVHLAISKDDVDGLLYALRLEESSTPLSTDPEQSLANRYVSSMDLINALSPASGYSPLHSAAVRGAAACTKVLLKHGALVHVRDALDHTALYYATIQGHEAIVDMLLETGAHFMGADLAPGTPNSSLCWEKAIRAMRTR